MLASLVVLAPDRPVRLMFVLATLHTGGAERHLLQILPRLDPHRFSPVVCCLKADGDLHGAFEEAGIPVVVLGHGKGRELRAFTSLFRLMRRDKPDVVISWGFSAEVLSRLAAYAARVPVRVVWKHNCGHVRRRLREKVADRLLARITDFYLGVAFGQVTYLVDGLGIPGDKVRIVRLGVAPDRFGAEPSPRVTRALRDELGIGTDERVISKIAVLRPEKDHETFLRGARLLVDRIPQARFLVVGGPEEEVMRLRRFADRLGLGDRVIFTGLRSDIGDLLAVTDVVVLSSYTVECFPVSILEAYCAGVPSVCTAIGGLPEMVDEGITGHLVAPRDPRALSDAVARILEQDGRAEKMGRSARERFERRFTLDACVEETDRVFWEMATSTRAGSGPER